MRPYLWLLVTASAVAASAATVAHESNPLSDNFDFPNTVSPTKFDIRVKQDFIDQNLRKVRDFRPSRSLFSNWTLEGPPDWAIDALAHYWDTEYQWRQTESRINQFDHFATTVPGSRNYSASIPLHFVHQRSNDTNATPILLLHGWTSSHLDWSRIIGPLAQNGNTTFHVVAPDLPGYGFSPAPTKPSMGPREMGAAFDALMKQLGYERYGVVSTDLGWILGMWMAQDFADSLIGLFTDFYRVPPLPSDITRQAMNQTTKEENDFIDVSNAWDLSHAAYAAVQIQKPQALSLAMTDSPVGFAGWLWDLRYAISDDYSYTYEELITDAMLLWIQPPYGSMRSWLEYNTATGVVDAEEDRSSNRSLTMGEYERPVPVPFPVPINNKLYTDVEVAAKLMSDLMPLLRITTLLLAPALAWGLQLLPPPVQFSATSNGSVWQVASTPKIIYIQNSLADKVDTDGLTLIPPSGNDFAALFQVDIGQLTGANWTLQRVDRLPCPSSTGGILLGAFSGNGSSITYENEQPTSEGYELRISPKGAFIGGTGARGMWWGTRTLLQALSMTNGSVPVGHAVDAPAHETRGFMLDAGRKWYAPGFLKELCSYASFFKMSEFHYHLSDNYPLNRGRNESWQDVYSHFSLRPEDESLLPILHGRENETLTREDFADLQRHCAARGVTVIPEIEAPGHCLYLTKWKPELSLPKRDLLNLSHPDTIPTVQRIWSEFLPWFETKEVHVGADEYDSALADVYIGFVNEMSDFINSTTGKRIRIWGTNEPSDNFTISRDVIIQHWQYGQSDPVLLVNSGYDIINSEDWWAYMSLKNDHMPILPARYPQFFNESRVLNFADESGWQWTPADYNPFNTTEQVPHGSPSNKGAILAAWNDNGPDASTQLEAYYAMRRGIALAGARSWSGSRGPVLLEDDVAPSIDFFSPIAPGQNLDRVLSASGSSGSLYSWARSSEDGETVNLNRGSKGMNYTMKLSVTAPFSLAGPDNTLSLDSNGSLIFNADGYLYPLREVSQQDALQLDPGHPGRIWVNVSTSTHEAVKVPLPANITIETDALHGSMAWLNGEFAGRFEVFVYGGRNTQFSWSQMAFTAPLDSVIGEGLQCLVVEDTKARE